MSSTDLLALMNQEIDGRNSPGDSARLREILARDPEARREFQDLQELTSMLERIESKVPPPDLAGSILAGVRRARPAPPQPRAAWWRTAWWLGPQTLRFAYVFVAGLGLGIAAAVLARGGPVDFHTLPGVSGALGPSASRQSSGDLVTTPFRFDGGAGTARVLRTAGGVAVVVETTPRAGGEAELSLSLGGAGLLGYRVDSGHVEQVSADRDSVRWTQAGPARITWHLAVHDSGGAGVELTAGLEGREPFRTNFLIPRM